MGRLWQTIYHFLRNAILQNQSCLKTVKLDDILPDIRTMKLQYSRWCGIYIKVENISMEQIRETDSHIQQKLTFGKDTMGIQWRGKGFQQMVMGHLDKPTNDNETPLLHIFHKINSRWIIDLSVKGRAKNSYRRK